MSDEIDAAYNAWINDPAIEQWWWVASNQGAAFRAGVEWARQQQAVVHAAKEKTAPALCGASVNLAAVGPYLWSEVSCPECRAKMEAAK